MKGFRASALAFDAAGLLQWFDDALLIVDAGRIVSFGHYGQMAQAHSGVMIEAFPGCILAPGFIDTHVHYPQLDVIGSPASGLLPWLENYTFPHESKFGDPDVASEVAQAFLDQLMGNGVTTASVYCTAHRQSVDAFMHASRDRGLRMIAGMSMQDRNSPPALTQDTETSLRECEALIQAWHGTDRLGYAITPRFAPSCSDAQMKGMAELARRYPEVWLQTHVAENKDEIAWVAQLYPDARSYLDVYDRFGMLRPRSIYAHSIWLDEQDRTRLAQSGAAIAMCPTSNLFLGSGLFNFEATDRAGAAWALACDVGGGSSFSPFKTMFAAYQIARLQGQALSPQALWWHHTLGAAKALGLGTTIGNLEAGFEADAIVIDPQATTLLARRWSQATTLEERLFALQVLADDRAIRTVIVAGNAMPSLSV
jgi:guanine deaminase